MAATSYSEPLETSIGGGVLGVDKAASAEEITQYESVVKKNLRIGDMKQNTQREREREAQRISLLSRMQ